MFWADRIAKNIIESGKYKPYWVDDMKTPSGRIHVGSLRGVLIHELVWRALRDAGQNAAFTWVYDDQDPMDALPHYLDSDIWGKYLGQPLFTIPSPGEGAPNYAAFYANEFTDIFASLGCGPKILWSSELYKSGKMNDGINICLDNVDKIREVYEELYKKKLQPDWYPFQVVCPKCGKESTTRVNNWNGNEVSFQCKIDAVDWTKGCGYEGKASPFSGKDTYAGKLSWKVEWAVKWKVIGVTVEGAGKDHMSAGGSHDVASLICERILNYPVPFPVPYEFFLIGGKKMSSSKGIGSSSKEVSEIVPPYLLRFLFTRTDYKQAIDFEPMGTMVIPDLFDEYDRSWQAYNKGSDEVLSRIFEISQISVIPDKNRDLFIPRFRDIANLTQLPNIKLLEKIEQMKGSKLTDEEKTIVKDRLVYANIWINNYAPDDYKFQLSAKPYDEFKLNDKQWQFLNDLSEIWDTADDPEQLQSEIFGLIKDNKFDQNESFKALYTVILDKSHGPRAGWLLKKFEKKAIINRLKLNTISGTGIKKKEIRAISHPDIFSIDPAVKAKFPSVSIGLAIIKGVTIRKSDENLEREKNEFLNSLSELTTEELGKYPEIISYRKLYREMGIDWHSRRPSPEALLRRIALKKGLYAINTCVDAYNLIVMKNRVSVGAFDNDTFSFPTILRFPEDTEEILLLGDEKPTKYSPNELAYFDKIGGYNIDFNFRDAQRTAVTLKTKNILLNVDGIYDITPEMVQETLDESVEIVTKYCGGNVEFKGVVT